MLQHGTGQSKAYHHRIIKQISIPTAKSTTQTCRLDGRDGKAGSLALNFTSARLMPAVTSCSFLRSASSAKQHGIVWLRIPTAPCPPSSTTPPPPTSPLPPHPLWRNEASGPTLSAPNTTPGTPTPPTTTRQSTRNSQPTRRASCSSPPSAPSSALSPSSFPSTTFIAVPSFFYLSPPSPSSSSSPAPC